MLFYIVVGSVYYVNFCHVVTILSYVCMCFVPLLSMSDPSMYHEPFIITFIIIINMSSLSSPPPSHLYMSHTVSESFCLSISLWANAVCCINLTVNKAYLTFLILFFAFSGTPTVPFHFHQWLDICAVKIGISYSGHLCSKCQQVLGHPFFH